MYSTYRAATVPVFLRIVDIILLQDGVTQHWKGQQPPIHWPPALKATAENMSSAINERPAVFGTVQFQMNQS
jgi:hypothetical protein